MSSHLDYFSDLIKDGEHIRSTVAGPAAPEPGGESWVQLATTESQVLAVLLQKGPMGNYQPTHRMAAPISDVQIARYPKTDQSAARLEITGLEIPIVMVDIDRPDIFPLVEPFIVSWGGRLGGAGTVQPTPAPAQANAIDEKKLVMIALALLGITLFFCACAGILGALITFTKSSF